MDTKEKYRHIGDLIFEKKYEEAKNVLKNIMQKHPKYVEYKKTLKEAGLDYKKVSVPDSIYLQIENILNEYDRELQLKILDHAYLKIAKNQ